MAFDDIEPFIFAFVVMRPRAAARRADIEKSRELFAGLFSVEQRDYGVTKRVQRRPSLARVLRVNCRAVKWGPTNPIFRIGHLPKR
jgi:hypothetical protein